MDSGHPDHPILDRIATHVFERAGGKEKFRRKIPELIQSAIDFVVDPVSTARTRIRELDNVEKTFVGLKIEHFFRDFIDVPKGIRDLSIDGIDVDVKNTVRSTWMIPPETVRNAEPVLLFMIAEDQGTCSVGLIVAKEDYLNAGVNRDSKRGVSAAAKAHIYWLADKEALPDSSWVGIDMLRFRQLRKEIKSGSKRAAQFFRENLDRPIHRSVVQSLLYDQDDYMKRLRYNQGARGILIKEGIAILSGFYHGPLIERFALPRLARDEHISHRLDPEELGAFESFELAKGRKKKRD